MVSLSRCFALLVAIGGLQSAIAQPYPIKLERPDVVGATFTIDATGVSRQTLSQKVGDESRNQEEDYRVSLAGDASVLAVTSRGAISKLSVKVKTCEVQSGKESARALIAPGATIIAEGKGHGQVAITVDDKQPEADVVAKLQSVLAVVGSEDSSDADKMFGATESKSPGDEWKINAEQCAKELSQTDMQVAPESVSGKVKFTGMRDVAGQQNLEIVAAITAKDLKLELPATLQAQTATAQVTFTALVPPDPKLPARLMQMEVDFNLSATGKREDGKPLSLEVQRKTSTRVERIDHQ